MTKPKDKNAATEPKNVAPKKEATPKAATPKAAGKAPEKAAEAPVTEQKTTPAAEAAAPKTEPAPESAKTEQETPKTEQESTVSGGLGDLLGLLTGGKPVDLSQIFKVLSAPEEEKQDGDKDKTEGKEDREEGFAEEILTRVLGMAAHPVFGVGISPQQPPVRELNLEEFFASANLFDIPEGFGGSGCCADDENPFYGLPCDQNEEPTYIVERDEVTASMGHLIDLKKLLDGGILTEEEYANKKRDILRYMYP